MPTGHRHTEYRQTTSIINNNTASSKPWPFQIKFWKQKAGIILIFFLQVFHSMFDNILFFI